MESAIVQTADERGVEPGVSPEHALPSDARGNLDGASARISGDIPVDRSIGFQHVQERGGDIGGAQHSDASAGR